MTGLEAALWGLLGSGVAEALNLSASMRPTGPRRRWRWPWSSPADRPVVLVAIALRLFAGFGLTAALGTSDQLPNATAALAAGLAAPLIVARFFQSIPLAEPGAQQRPDTALPTTREPSDRLGLPAPESGGSDGAR
ncbi:MULTISPECIES: hypothetical protein [Streptomyces]|uniref:Cation/H+ exchanger domain-containing protein n=2 Tax=Streptomyces TaxID=1883 RepID=A0AB39SDF0_9ACTN|nr:MULTISPECIES: hypothetical protein [unclassified Streptomyces]WSP74332.1 hypothetical protein OG324_34780 [Streptomyces sp. NBC_01236]WTI36124.1 hypothetical protein OIC96_14500 [Streptomyces sp. NBC_00775]WUB30202.1 hypothetical protein OHA51_35230 [Streptomyces sp. NBC_00589]